MRFEQIQPPEHLRRHVRYFWIMEPGVAGDPPASFKTIVDGCPGLIFQPKDKGILFQNEKQLPDTFLYGQATTYAELRVQGTFCITGAYLYPHALQSIFGLNAEVLTDSCTALDTNLHRCTDELSEQLSEALTAEERIRIFSTYLYERICKSERTAEDAMEYAWVQIVRSKGSVAMKDLHETLQLSERSFERRFKQHVGLSPKLFARICRFQSSLGQLRQGQYDKLSDIAYEHEYSDQSHFIRSFKEFAGVSPFQYQKKPDQVFENFPELKL